MPPPNITRSNPNDPKPSLTEAPTEPHPPKLKPIQMATSDQALRSDDPRLRSKWAHRAWVASGCTMVLVSLARSITAAAGSRIWVGPVLASLAGYILADLGSGVYHWAIDNYGDAKTPIFGPQIEGFLRHHKRPWIITQTHFANNLAALGQGVTFTALPLNLLLHHPTHLAFIGSFAGFVLFSQQFHAWSHMSKRNLPKVVVIVQEMGVLLSRPEHGAHHRPPFNSNYCIVSGICNKFLDEVKFFKGLEMVVFFLLGVRPRSWNDLGSEWTEEDSSPSS